MAVGRTRPLVVALLVALLVADAAVHASPRSRFRRLHRVEDTGLDELSNDDVTEGTFTQKLCHFNSQVTDTWAQRFWQNDQFFKDGGPQFLNIGGEGPESGKRISHPSLPIVQWASQVNARIWNLEHRFYGKSRPTADQSVDNLKFLNSRQALEDLADFIAAKNKELNIQNPRWVVFGGSYPGALTLWFRVVHPELTVGGVGSSAPIEVVTDFFDYLRVCEDSFRSFSPQCAENIRAGFESLREHLDSADQRAELDQAFNFQPPLASMDLDWKNLQNVYKTVLDPFMETVQYAQPNTETNGSIAEVCTIMAQNASSPINRLAKVHSYRQEASGQPLVTPVSYENDVANLRNESFESTYASDRSWTWQTCNEFGYFQTTGYNGIFGTFAPVDFDINLCADVFGAEFTIDEIRGRVQATRDHYGRARDYNGTNVVIPNGSLDPWHALGTYTPKDPTVVSVLIDGTAHCADRESANETTDLQSLKDARTTIWANIQQWLGGSSSAEQPAGQPAEETGLTARRAPAFPTTICFDCDAESGNKNKLRNPMPAHLQQKFGNRFRRLGLGEKKFADRPHSNAVKSGWITQKLDHFDEADNRTFQQLIYKNDEYFDKNATNPVVFLFIFGEDAASEGWITGEEAPIVSWAKQFGARLYLLEHRFYGKSLPFDSMTVENLHYLTSEQARSKHKCALKGGVF
ncbi:Peptidase S28 family-containing protein [Aphelenchoides fujianensis]|nr:Peptidase S28 family-containing protein [Aphelenchoides fujianensis]